MWVHKIQQFKYISKKVTIFDVQVGNSSGGFAVNLLASKFSACLQLSFAEFSIISIPFRVLLDTSRGETFEFENSKFLPPTTRVFSLFEIVTHRYIVNYDRYFRARLLFAARRKNKKKRARTKLCKSS